MAAEPAFNVSDLIDARPLGALQIRIVILCTLVALLDGLDLQSIGLAAPGIAADLHIQQSWLSAVFSAALAGLALGAFGFGMLADRAGRKPVLIGATACFGIFTICTALAPSFTVLLVFRFLAGLGLGGAMPSFISLTSEYCPRRLRAVIVALLWAGFPLGGFVGGLLASWIIPAYGWHSVFWVGGVLPLLVCIVLIVALPEFVGFLVASAAPAERIASLLRQMFPSESVPAGATFVLNEERVRGVPVVQLFAAGRAVGTVLLWISFFIALMMLVTNSAWAPTLLKREGIGIKDASLAMAMFNLGSVIATSFAGWLISRAGAAIILPLVDARQRRVGGADRLCGALRRHGHPAARLVRRVHGRRLVRPHRACRDLLSDRDPLDRRRLGHGHGPCRLFHWSACRRFAGGVRLIDGGHFCCHSCAGAPCRGDHGGGRPRQTGLSCGDENSMAFTILLILAGLMGAGGVILAAAGAHAAPNARSRQRRLSASFPCDGDPWRHRADAAGPAVAAAGARRADRLGRRRDAVRRRCFRPRLHRPSAFSHGRARRRHDPDRGLARFGDRGARRRVSARLVTAA